MSTSLLEEETIEKQPAKPKPVQLRTAHDYTLTTQALEMRVDSLKKLAKKNEEEEYHREARAILADATAIETIILPQFSTQQELPLVTSKEVRSGIMNAFHAVIHRFAVDSDNSVLRADSANGKSGKSAVMAETHDRWQGKREEQLAEKIAFCVEAFGLEIAEVAFAAGLSARENSPESLALKSVAAIHRALGEG